MKILLVDVLYLGDLLFITPAIRVLKNAYPDAIIDVVVNKGSQEILQHHPLIRRVIGVETPKIDPPLKLWSLVRQLRRERYDLAICFQGGNERTSLLTGLCGAKRRGGYVKPSLKFLYTGELAIPADDLIILAPKHVTEIYIDLLVNMGIPRSAHRGLEMWPGEEAERSADALWERLGLVGKSPIVGVVAGQVFPTKLWMAEGFAQLCDLLADAGTTPVLFGGPKDVERVESIRAMSKSQPTSLAGKISLLELAAVVRKCTLIVSGDTGPIHIAASQHVPVVGIYTRTLRQTYSPLNTEHLFVAGDVPCLECNKHDCDDMRCMTELSAEHVVQGVQQLLARIAPSMAA